MKVTIPIKLDSLANMSHHHWRTLSGIKTKHKTAVRVALYGIELPSLPASILFTRIGKKRLDDDNLPNAFKAMRDAVATLYGVDDGDDSYIWRYAQRIGKEYGVEIEIHSINPWKHEANLQRSKE